MIETIFTILLFFFEKKKPALDLRNVDNPGWDGTHNDFLFVDTRR
jgi:hypothetical protein